LPGNWKHLTITTAKWPAGIDIINIMWRKALRHYTAGRGLTGSLEIDDRDVAMAQYITNSAYPDGSKRAARVRLARLYIRDFRRELIREQHYLEAAARLALMDTAPPGATS
jgi:hypothetical protein